MIAIDIELSEVVESKGTAYYRLPDNFFEFLKKCEEENVIIGFEYESGNRNFGVILKQRGV